MPVEQYWSNCPAKEAQQARSLAGNVSQEVLQNIHTNAKQFIYVIGEYNVLKNRGWVNSDAASWSKCYCCYMSPATVHYLFCHSWVPRCCGTWFEGAPLGVVETTLRSLTTVACRCGVVYNSIQAAADEGPTDYKAWASAGGAAAEATAEATEGRVAGNRKRRVPEEDEAAPEGEY